MLRRQFAKLRSLAADSSQIMSIVERSSMFTLIVNNPGKIETV